MARNALAQAAVVVLALAMPAGGCDKKGAASAAPGDGGGKQAAGVSLRYGAKARKLKQKTDFEFTISGGGQYGELKMSLLATLDLAPQGDKMKVAWKIDDVASMELKGMMKPKAKEGEPAPADPKATLVEKGNGAWVMDLRGESDDDATKALPENEAKRKRAEERKKAREAKKAEGDKKDDNKGEEKPNGGGDEPAVGDQLLQYLDGVFQLPSLPEQRLEVGTPLKIEEEEEAPLGGEGSGGPVLPIESETTYTLLKIDESGGQRIAEFEVEVEASGATEFQGGMLVVDQATSGTLLFNLDEGIPVQVNLESSQSFTVGDRGSELTTILASTFEPG